MIERITRRHFYRYFGFASALLTLSVLGFTQVAERARILAEPRATVSPTPGIPDPNALKKQMKPGVTPTPSPTPTPAPVQTIEELQTSIRQKIFAPEVRRGRIGVKIVSLNSGKVIFEADADKYFTPASNMKNFTIAAALEKLGPDFKFKTQVYGPRPDSAGVVKGALRIIGGGDISISTAFFGTTPDDPETYYKGIDRLVEAIAAAGVKRVEGDLVGDEGYFRGFAIPLTWEWDDLQWRDGSEVSALPINDNDVDLSVKPGPNGGPCIVKITPPNNLYKIENVCSTSNAGTKRQLTVNKRLDQNVLWVGGSMPADDKGFTGALTVSHPADLFLAILKERLAKRGIVVNGQTNTIRNADYHPTTPLRPYIGTYDKPELLPIELARLESPPFSVVAAKTMKPSQNMYTETILWVLGEVTETDPRAENPPVVGGVVYPERPNSADLGLRSTKQFRDSVGIPSDAVIQYDGSGMSRHDVVTPNAVVQLYTYMAKQSKYAQVWRDSLSVGGVDGTLRNRFKGTLAEGNMRGKTGTLDQVSALSGYLTTAGGEQWVVSILVNGVADPRTRISLIDAIVVDLAKFNGKVDQER